MPERSFMTIVADSLDQVEGISAAFSECFDLEM
jgi:hypothetical protein